MDPHEPLPEVTTQQTADEMARLPDDPWLPAETALVLGSLILGSLLLGLLLWVSYTYFPIS